VVSFKPRPLYPRGKNPQGPSDRRLRAHKCRSGRDGEEKNIPLLPLPGIEPRSSSP